MGREYTNISIRYHTPSSTDPIATSTINRFDCLKGQFATSKNSSTLSLASKTASTISINSLMLSSNSQQPSQLCSGSQLIDIGNIGKLNQSTVSSLSSNSNLPLTSGLNTSISEMTNKPILPLKQSQQSNGTRCSNLFNTTNFNNLTSSNYENCFHNFNNLTDPSSLPRK